MKNALKGGHNLCGVFPGTNVAGFPSGPGSAGALPPSLLRADAGAIQSVSEEDNARVLSCPPPLRGDRVQQLEWTDLNGPNDVSRLFPPGRECHSDKAVAQTVHESLQSRQEAGGNRGEGRMGETDLKKQKTKIRSGCTLVTSVDQVSALQTLTTGT